MAKTWQTMAQYGKHMAKAWQNMADTWQKNMQNMATTTWQTHGKIMATFCHVFAMLAPGRQHGNTWQNMAKHGQAWQTHGKNTWQTMGKWQNQPARQETLDILGAPAAMRDCAMNRAHCPSRGPGSDA